MPDLDGQLSQFTASLATPLVDLIIQAPLPGLDARPACPPLLEYLRESEPQDWILESTSPPRELLSALWLLAGDLDRSHEISQSLKNRNGSFLHGIMHRREGDFSNAKYWFNRAGGHPVAEQLSVQHPQLYGDSDHFVDQCQAACLRKSASNEASAALESLRHVQWEEWRNLACYLFDYTS